MSLVPIILTILFSSFKFAATFPLVIIQYEFSFLETILWTNVGGILGVYFFAFLSEKLIAANLFWSVIYTGFYMFWEELLLKRA